MGTNFYLTTPTTRQHIGKRSVAGLYCWDCKKTLCIDGLNHIHENWNPTKHNKPRWFQNCPDCGATYNDNNELPEATAIELGFSKPTLLPKSGVGTCSSFTWAIEPAQVLFHKGEIEDEYKDWYSISEFLQMIETQCPIQFELIGETFS